MNNFMNSLIKSLMVGLVCVAVYFSMVMPAQAQACPSCDKAVSQATTVHVYHYRGPVRRVLARRPIRRGLRAVVQARPIRRGLRVLVRVRPLRRLAYRVRNRRFRPVARLFGARGCRRCR